MSEYTNLECPMCGTEYCSTLGQKNCESCAFKKETTAKLKQIMVDVDFVKAMLPDGSMAGLTELEECQLCLNEKRKATCYAVADMANKEPEGEKRSALGLKVRTSVGSIVAAQIPCCDRCRRNYRLSAFLSVAIGIVCMLVALVLLSNSEIAQRLENVHQIMPLVAFVGAAALGLILGFVARKLFDRKAQQQTRYNFMDVPFLTEMEKRGWFPLLPKSSGAPKVVFSKTRLKRGWFV